MARPKAAPWTLGTIHVTGDRSTGYVARGYYRDADDKRRDVTARGSTKAKAENALKAKVEKHRTEHRGGDATLNHDTPLAQAAQIWFQSKAAGSRAVSERSLTQYKGNVERYITRKPISTRPLSKVNNVSVIEAWLAEIANEHGTSAARAARKVLSGTLKLAERRGAIPYSVMARVDSQRAAPGSNGDRKCADAECDYDCSKWHHDTDRAFTEAEVRTIFAALDESDPSDIADLGHFLFGTGARVSEALHCASWNDLDLNSGEVRIRGTKAKAADRFVTLSPALVERLRFRKTVSGSTGLVFGITRYATKLGEPRETANVVKKFRILFDSVDMPWAGTHTFRRTVATWMDANGVPLAQIADQLGHANTDVTLGYLGRKAKSTAAASVMTLD